MVHALKDGGREEYLSGACVRAVRGAEDRHGAAILHRKSQLALGRVRHAIPYGPKSGEVRSSLGYLRAAHSV